MTVEQITHEPIKIEGLYFPYNGEKKQPESLWFSDIESEATGKGRCHCMFDNKLHSVHTSDGKTYYNDDLAGVSAKYDGEKIYGFYRE